MSWSTGILKQVMHDDSAAIAAHHTVPLMLHGSTSCNYALPDVGDGTLPGFVVSS